MRDVAQLVEQRTENPCVTGSIPVGTTHFFITHKISSPGLEESPGVFVSSSSCVPRGCVSKAAVSLWKDVMNHLPSDCVLSGDAFHTPMSECSVPCCL